MKTKTARETAAMPRGLLRGRPARATKIRPRCTGQAEMEREVGKQMTEAMPYIVQASVEKARAGSLIHTKWLWGVMGEAERLAAMEELTEAPTLGSWLLSQLEQKPPAE
jgi:hypothetical protein